MASGGERDAWKSQGVGDETKSLSPLGQWFKVS